MSDLVALNNARTTFQRISDAKFFTGWVKQITPWTIVAYTCTDSKIENGDTFAFQVFGNGKDAFFRAVVSEQHSVDPGPLFSKKRLNGYSVELTCDVEGDMRFQDSRGQPRFFVSGFVAEVGGDQSTVIDIGPQGFSMVGDNEYAKGDRLTVIIKAAAHCVECEVEVRNCIRYPLHKDYHRTGVQIMSTSRIDSLKWKELYSTILDASRSVTQ